MDEPVVLEGSATPPSLLDYMADYGRGEKIPDEQLAAMVAEGYLFDVEQGNFTDLGFEKLAEMGVPVKEVNILTLGTDIHVPLPDRTKLHIRAGSQCLVVFGHRDKRTKLINRYDVVAGEDLPMLTVYANSKHEFSTHQWPAAWPLTGRYAVAP